MPTTPKPMVLIILDGWGYSEAKLHNPTQTTSTPTFDTLYKERPYALIQASGEAVGLPDGQIGNSEVGHLHLGAGRKVPQDFTRINADIQTGDFYQNSTITRAIEEAKATDKAIHIIGLVSPGGVHSHESHIMALIDMIAEHGISKSYLHAILDGRDVPPRSAKPSLEKFTEHYKTLPGGHIASVIGRYYAMDRDQRWDRTEKAYCLLTDGIADFHAEDAVSALEMAYHRDENDEFVLATSIHADNEKPVMIEDGDVVIFMNFRADRARQLSRALTEKDFHGFLRNRRPQINYFITLTEYTHGLTPDVAYPALTLSNTLGEFIAHRGLHQLRIAETEKYAHVTYFLNGGNEIAFDREQRQLIPSPKVATYDLQPEMSAIELTKQLVDAIESQQYDLIVCNYANPDMVGHTGITEAANKAVSVIDSCISDVLDALHKVNGEALITADHGNVELMFDENTGQPHTAHTTNLVPLIYVGRPAHFNKKQGALDDVAPTLLYLMGLEPPKEMTGHQLITLSE